MTVNNSRSWRGSLENGSTEGKYRRVRPDWELTGDPGGDALTAANRETLHPFYNYGPVTKETPNKVNPGKA